MRYIGSLLLSAAIILLGTSGAKAQETDDLVNSPVEKFDEFARAYQLENDILSMSYAIVKDGEILAAEGIGWQDHDSEEKTTADTSYLVASITKTFTAATLLAMEADGIIDLNDDFTKLSDWDGRCEWLSTSGNIFGGGEALDDGYTPPAIDCAATLSLRDVLQMRVLGEPGSNFMYNPIVFGRLSNWIEEQTGEPFDVWVRRYVIDKPALKILLLGGEIHMAATRSACSHHHSVTRPSRKTISRLLLYPIQR